MQVEKGHRYYVVFSARGESITGHAFVVLIDEDSSSQQSKASAFGYYPLQNNVVGVIKAHLGDVPGRLTDEVADPEVAGSMGLITDRVIVDVDRADFEAAKDVVNRWRTHARAFTLGQSDCVTFIEHVAQAIGLNTPIRAWDFQGIPNLLPQRYIRALGSSAVDGKPYGDHTFRIDAPTAKGRAHGTALVRHGQGSASMVLFKKGATRLDWKLEGGGTFVGNLFDDGKLNGVATSARGIKCECEFRGGLPNGRGKQIEPDGFTFEGMMTDGRFVGPGTATMPNGRTVKGTFGPDGAFVWKERSGVSAREGGNRVTRDDRPSDRSGGGGGAGGGDGDGSNQPIRSKEWTFSDERGTAVPKRQ